MKELFDKYYIKREGYNNTYNNVAKMYFLYIIYMCVCICIYTQMISSTNVHICVYIIIKQNINVDK